MPYWRMVFYATDTEVFLFKLAMSIGTCNILAAKSSNSVAALLLARKYTDNLKWKDSPWPLHLAVLGLQAAHFLRLFLTILVSCSFSGTTLQTAHFHLSTSFPLAPVFSQVQISHHRLVLPALPPEVLPSAASSPCPQPPSHPRTGVLSLTRPLQLQRPFLLRPGKTEVCSALCSFHLEHVQEGCNF